jgi:hypothetical protein
MKITKNTRLIVIIGYCVLMVSAISGFVTIYLEMVKSSRISNNSGPEHKLIELNNTLNNLYQAEGTAVIMRDVNNNILYLEYDSLMNCVFTQIDSMKLKEKDPQIHSDLDSLTTLLVKKSDNFFEMIHLMAQIENSTIKEITNTTVTTFGDTGKLNNLIINKFKNIQDTSKTVTEKKGFLRRVSDVFKSGTADTLTQIKTGSVLDKAELAAPVVSDTLIQYLRETGLVAEKKNAKIIRKLIDRQNEFHLINEQTGIKIDQILHNIKNAEYRNSLTTLNERNELLKKSFNLVVIIGLLALAVTIFFMSWTLKSVNEGISYRKKYRKLKNQWINYWYPANN